MMAPGLFANAFPREPSSPPAAPPVLPVLSGWDQVSPTPSKENRPPNRERRYARYYHAIMATGWLISAQPGPSADILVVRLVEEIEGADETGLLFGIN
jgi:hypothetical protein